MRKIISIILILILLNCYCITSFALAKQVTKSTLTNAFNEYAKGYNGEYTSESGGVGFTSFGESKPIEVTDTQLIDKNDSRTTYYVDYTLGNSPKFSTKVNITPDTDFSVISDLDDALEKPMLGLLGVTMSQGIAIGDAHNYYDKSKDIKAFKYTSAYATSRIGNQISITLDEETKTFDASNVSYDEMIPFLLEENKVIKDEKYDIYTYTVGYTKNSENNYTIEAVLEIKEDADFTKVGKKATSNNNTNNNSSETTNNNQQNNDNKEQLPRTGVNDVVSIAIAIVYVVALGLAIKIFTYKDVK